MKSFAPFILLAILCMFVPLNGVSAQNDMSENGLRFNSSGDFKIMVVSDVQDSADVLRYTIDLMTKAIEHEQPDLVVLNGDNIWGIAPSLIVSKKNVKKSIDQFLAPIVDNGIPFAVVFGNHDAEPTMSKKEQIEYYQSFPNCVATINTIGDREGNYNLLVYDNSGIPALNLWFLDSGRKATTEHGRGYAYVLDEQIAWYEQRAEELKELNNGNPIPAMLFQHIPVPEIYELLSIVDKDTANAVQGYGRHSRNYYVLNKDMVVDGEMNEAPCPPDFNNGQFGSWVSQGDIIAAVFGHDHINDFRGKYNGIELLYTSGVGFYSYGNGYKHGVRVIEFNEDSVHDYTTRMVYWEDIEELSSVQIPEKLLYDGGFMRGDIYVYIGIAAFILLALITALFLLIRLRIGRIKAKGSLAIEET